MRRIFLQRLHDGVVIRDVDHFHLLDPERHDLANRRRGQRLECAGDGHFTVENFRRQNLGREFFFVELLAQLQGLDRCRKA